jgi:5-methyltetrahydrofolate--homocysteine methyltransferase
MTILNKIKNNFVLFDGATGTQLQAAGFALQGGAGALELLNITDPDAVTRVHRQYVAAGSDIITSNTFGANALKLHGSGYGVDEIFAAAISNAKAAGAQYVAADIGPVGQLLEPMGTLKFEDAYDLFKQQILAAKKYGADIILIETMSDLYEAKAAVLAAKENCRLPVFCTMTFEQDLRTFVGCDALTAAVVLEGLGADALGVNCSHSIERLIPVVDTFVKYCGVPIIIQPNAGLPAGGGNDLSYDLTAAKYAATMKGFAKKGVNILGGCCGTTPAHIAALKAALKDMTPAGACADAERADVGGVGSVKGGGTKDGAGGNAKGGSAKNVAAIGATVATGAVAKGASAAKITKITAATSGTKTVILDQKISVIGERINPTGKKRLKDALKGGDIDYILGEAIAQAKAGADILDVNCGLVDVDEGALLSRVVKEIQSVVNLPLQIDSSDPRAIEAAARVYNGKPIINSVNGKAESMAAVFPIAKKYGALVVGLTLDDDGIPPTAAGRFLIAKRIVKTAKKYGICASNILIDCLVLTASAQQEYAGEVIEAVRLVKTKLGVRTLLGISNVSFGLPNRGALNSAFLAAALGAGLDAPIINPLSAEIMNTVRAFRVLSNKDVGAAEYIAASAASASAVSAGGAGNIANGVANGANAGGLAADGAVAPAASVGDSAPSGEKTASYLVSLILDGRKDSAVRAVAELLKKAKPLEIIDGYFIPAMNTAGERYDSGAIFLPQLMQTAETVKACFELIKDAQAGAASGAVASSKGKIIMATVKGDIHDIGKNIAKMLLANYGYRVFDLGKDVAADEIVSAAQRENVRLIGLSALMTTTINNMKQTIAKLKLALPDCNVMVGGAVLNEEYAKYVGADYYAKDAQSGVKIADKVFKE